MDGEANMVDSADARAGDGPEPCTEGHAAREASPMLDLSPNLLDMLCCARDDAPILIAENLPPPPSWAAALSAPLERRRRRDPAPSAFRPANLGDPFLDYPIVEPWDIRETLAREKQSLGFFLSSHPLDAFPVEFSYFHAVQVMDVASFEPWSRVLVVGVALDYEERVFREGGKIASFNLDDRSGRMKVEVRGRDIEPVGKVVGQQLDPVVFVKAVVKFVSSETPEEGAVGTASEAVLLLEDVMLVSDVVRRRTSRTVVRIKG